MTIPGLIVLTVSAGRLWPDCDEMTTPDPPRAITCPNSSSTTAVPGDGVVDEDVDATELVDRSSNRRLSIGTARHVELDRHQIVRLSQSLRYAGRVPATSHDRMSGRENRLGEIGTHAATRSSDEPDLLGAHNILHSLQARYLPTICWRRSGYRAPCTSI
jgi:hypothetical protein